MPGSFPPPLARHPVRLSPPAVLARVVRGGVTEATIRGHVAVIDGAGNIVGRAGDPFAVTTARSAVKPVQALPFIESGAADALDIDDDELAIACASHGGEAEQVEVVLRLLGRVGLGPDDLLCGPQPPATPAAAWALAAAGGTPGRIHNNCSGKHAAMLATCVHRRFSPAGYISPDHPLQREVRAALARTTGVNIAATPSGIDGCGLRTHGIPLVALARTVTAASSEPALRRCHAAMAAHPALVGGEARFDTALLAAAGTHVIGKTGGAAVWVGGARDGSCAIAIKLEAGGGDAIGPVAIAALLWAHVLRDVPPLLEPHLAPPIRAWSGAVVGVTQSVLDMRTG